MAEDSKPKNDHKQEQLEKEFKLYMHYIKNIASKLKSSEERARVSAWILSLSQSEPKSENIVEYTKLLLWAIHCSRLVGPFSKFPSETVEPYPKGYNTYQMGLDMLSSTPKPQDLGSPVIKTISPETREYFSCQEIPSFGVQCYYAFSKSEPISKWKFRKDQPTSSDGGLPKLSKDGKAEIDEKGHDVIDGSHLAETSSEELTRKDLCRRVCSAEKILKRLSELGSKGPQNIRTALISDGKEMERLYGPPPCGGKKGQMEEAAGEGWGDEDEGETREREECRWTPKCLEKDSTRPPKPIQRKVNAVLNNRTAPFTTTENFMQNDIQEEAYTSFEMPSRHHRNALTPIDFWSSDNVSDLVTIYKSSTHLGNLKNKEEPNHGSEPLFTRGYRSQNKDVSNYPLTTKSTINYAKKSTYFPTNEDKYRHHVDSTSRFSLGKGPDEVTSQVTPTFFTTQEEYFSKFNQDATNSTTLKGFSNNYSFDEVSKKKAKKIPKDNYYKLDDIREWDHSDEANSNEKFKCSKVRNEDTTCELQLDLESSMNFNKNQHNYNNDRTFGDRNNFVSDFYAPDEVPMSNENIFQDQVRNKSASRRRYNADNHKGKNIRMSLEKEEIGNITPKFKSTAFDANQNPKNQTGYIKNYFFSNSHSSDGRERNAGSDKAGFLDKYGPPNSIFDGSNEMAKNKYKCKNVNNPWHMDDLKQGYESIYEGTENTRKNIFHSGKKDCAFSMKPFEGGQKETFKKFHETPKKNLKPLLGDDYQPYDCGGKRPVERQNNKCVYDSSDDSDQMCVPRFDPGQVGLRRRKAENQERSNRGSSYSGSPRIQQYIPKSINDMTSNDDTPSTPSTPIYYPKNYLSTPRMGTDKYCIQQTTTANSERPIISPEYFLTNNNDKYSEQMLSDDAFSDDQVACDDGNRWSSSGSECPSEEIDFDKYTPAQYSRMLFEQRANFWGAGTAERLGLYPTGSVDMNLDESLERLETIMEECSPPRKRKRSTGEVLEGEYCSDEEEELSGEKGAPEVPPMPPSPPLHEDVLSPWKLWCSSGGDDCPEPSD